MSTGQLTVELPHGLFDDDGTCHRVAVLRALAGHEELALAETLEEGARAVSAWLATLVVRMLAGEHRERAAALWARLVELGPEPMSTARWLALPATARHAIALALAEHGRAPDLTLVARCPACRALLELDLDPFGLLARELRAGGERIFAEVHALAFHYHWSEDAILALPRPRRWKYLELLARELEGRPLVDRWS